ncbi:hypothetical protein [Paraburkholderia caribensis]|uniref:hypothetical protein n=1 Tax=Paraburkholderia caribensis TaxID=75105 RepID=UPI00078CFC71|nr:hypothetical protein [Paraburkholderia caribensis]AMV47813.1 hypothetical protein ATN79_44915 [Paraburkholderia caribensis]
MNSGMRRHLYKVRDWIFPRLDPLSKDELRDQHDARCARNDRLNERLDALSGTEEVLKEHLESTGQLLEQEKSRQHSVEGKLAGVIGLSSVAATVLFTGLVARANTNGEVDPVVKWGLPLGLLYLILQLFCALSAAISGITSKAYGVPTFEDVLPPRAVAKTTVLRRRIRQNLELLEEHRETNNGKVSQLNVAHQAMLNLLKGLLFVAFVAAYGAIATRPAAPAVNVTVKTEGAASDAAAAIAPAYASNTRTAGPESGALPPRTKGNPNPVSLNPEDAQAVANTERAMLGSIFQIGASLAGTVIGSVLFAFGLFYLLAREPRRNVAAGLVLTGAGLFTGAVSGNELKATGIHLDKLFESLQFEYSPKTERVIASTDAVVLSQIAKIGPFPSGEHQLDADVTRVCLEKAIKELDSSSLFGWQIVGGVDKRQLRSDRAAIYGTNQGLAMTRATWVRDEVLKKIEPDAAVNAITAVAGAANVGLRVEESMLAADRAVYVYALVRRDRASIENRPVTCP